MTTMTSTFPTPLDARVAARNALHRTALDVTPAVLDALKPLVGKKVLRATGDFTKTFLDAVGSLAPRAVDAKGVHDVWGWYRVSGTTLFLNLKTSRNVPLDNGGSVAYYEEMQVALGTLGYADYRSLADVATEVGPYRTNYKADDVRAARARVADARAAVSAAQNDLDGFGETDR